MRFRTSSMRFLLTDVIETARRACWRRARREDGTGRQGDGETGGKNLSRPVAQSRESPSRVLIIFRHRVNDADCQNIFDGVSRPRNYFGERVTIFFRELRQDEVRSVGYRMLRRDSQ